MDADQAAVVEDRDKTIRRVYYGKDGGSSAYKTYLDAKAIDPRITLDWVRDWFKKNVERTRQVGGAKNNYVAPRAFHEYQADVFYITDRQFPNQDYPYGLSIIDVFSKFATVIPLKERDADRIMPALFKAFQVIGKQPEILYTDDEGALNKKWVAAEFERAGIQHIITAGSAHFVERFNRTFKNLISARMKALKVNRKIIGKQPEIDKTKIQWSDLIPNVLAEYNNKNKHRITGMTPAEAAKPSSEVDAKMAMELVARRGRKFPILNIGDTVKVLRKHKAVGDKEFMDQFKKGEHTVESISENFGHKFYKLSDGKEYIRSDIVKMKK